MKGQSFYVAFLNSFGHYRLHHPQVQP